MKGNTVMRTKWKVGNITKRKKIKVLKDLYEMFQGTDRPLRVRADPLNPQKICLE